MVLQDTDLCLRVCSSECDAKQGIAMGGAHPLGEFENLSPWDAQRCINGVHVIHIGVIFDEAAAGSEPMC